MTRQNCEDCAFFDEGECHRLPPDVDGWYPSVALDSWCGMFEARPSPPIPQWKGGRAKIVTVERRGHEILVFHQWLPRWFGHNEAEQIETSYCMNGGLWNAETPEEADGRSRFRALLRAVHMNESEFERCVQLIGRVCWTYRSAQGEITFEADEASRDIPASSPPPPPPCWGRGSWNPTSFK